METLGRRSSEVGGEENSHDSIRSTEGSIENANASSSFFAGLLDEFAFAADDAADLEDRHDYPVHAVAGPARPSFVGGFRFGGGGWLGEWL